MKRMLAQLCHVLPGRKALPVDDINGTGYTGDYINAADYGALHFIILAGEHSGATAAVTFTQATAAAGTGAKAVTFTKMHGCAALGSSVIPAETAVSSSTFNITNADNQLYVVTLYPDQHLDNAGGFDWVRINIADPSAAGDVAVAVIGDNPRITTFTDPTS